MRVLRQGSMLQSLRGQQTAARGRRTATCPPPRPGPATSNHPLHLSGREQGDATVLTKRKRNEAQPSTSSSLPSGLFELEDTAGLDTPQDLGMFTDRALLPGETDVRPRTNPPE